MESKSNWVNMGIVENPGVSDEEVAKLETMLGAKFPSLYIDLIKFSKAPSPEAASFEYDDAGTAISEFFEFSSEIHPYTIAWYARANAIDGLPNKIIPIARDAGDYLVCFDFNEATPCVVIFDPNSKIISHVADDFESFVRSWHE